MFLFCSIWGARVGFVPTLDNGIGLHSFLNDLWPSLTCARWDGLWDCSLVHPPFEDGDQSLVTEVTRGEGPPFAEDLWMPGTVVGSSSHLQSQPVRPSSSVPSYRKTGWMWCLFSLSLTDSHRGLSCSRTSCLFLVAEDQRQFISAVLVFCCFSFVSPRNAPEDRSSIC